MYKKMNLKFVLFSSVQTLPTKIFTGSECPTGWWFLGETFYFFEQRKKIFHEAERLCQNMNSKLFEPRDLQTNNLVFKTAENC